MTPAQQKKRKEQIVKMFISYDSDGKFEYRECFVNYTNSDKKCRQWIHRAEGVHQVVSELRSGHLVVSFTTDAVFYHCLEPYTASIDLPPSPSR